MENKLNIIFMGTPEFAVPALKEVHKKYGIKAVVTVPDKPQGRGKKIQPSPVKESAIELNIPILQPEKTRDPDFIQAVKELHPDIIVVIAFRILPEEVYSQAKIATFNVHTSLLPRYRGAAPINHCIINGDKESGLTSFILKPSVDTGDIILQQKIQIKENITFGELYNELMQTAPNFTIETIESLVNNSFTPILQDDTKASPAPKIFADDCKINWADDNIKIKNFIHGVSPIPGAWTIFNGERLKIYRAEAAGNELNEVPGAYSIDKKQFKIACGIGSIIIKELQPAGKKAQPVNNFLNGYRGKADGVFL